MKRPKPHKKKKRGNATPWTRSEIVKKGWATRRALAKAEARKARARSAAVKKSWKKRRENAERDARLETFSPDEWERQHTEDLIDLVEIEEILRTDRIDLDDDGDDAGSEGGHDWSAEESYDVEEPIASSSKKQYKSPAAGPLLNWADNPIFEKNNAETQPEIETEAARESGASPIRKTKRGGNKGVDGKKGKGGGSPSPVRKAKRGSKKGMGHKARKRDKRGRFVRSGKHSKSGKKK